MHGSFALRIWQYVKYDLKRQLHTTNTMTSIRTSIEPCRGNAKVRERTEREVRVVGE